VKDGEIKFLTQGIEALNGEPAFDLNNNVPTGIDRVSDQIQGFFNHHDRPGCF